MIRLCLLHFFGNALLLWLGYAWLGVGEADNVHVLGSFFIVLVLIAGAAWLHGAGFAYFGGLRFTRALGRALRNLLPILSVCLAGILVYAGLIWTASHYGGTAYNVASYSTMHLRRPVPPTAIEKAFHWCVLLLEWVIVPVVLFPLASAVAMHGWKGWRLANLHKSRRILYWVEICLLLLCAFVVPFRLFFWVPGIQSFSGQMLSFLARNVLGYVLFVSSLLAIEFFSAVKQPHARSARAGSSAG